MNELYLMICGLSFRKLRDGYVFAYHHPESITWRWALRLSREKISWSIKFGPSYSMGKKFFAPDIVCAPSN